MTAAGDDSLPHDDKLDKIRSLIAKAESTPHAAEAESFMAKAQSLMAIYAIDEARLYGAATGTIGEERVSMEGSYSRERAFVWGAAAMANRCRILTWSAYRSNAVAELSLVGRSTDRELVKVLATSLELQAVQQMYRLDTDSGYESVVVQRRSFLRGFAHEIGRRLEEANDQQKAYGAAAAALVLASEAVDEFVDDNFSLSNRRATNRIDPDALRRGQHAGRNADVGNARMGANRRALRR